jgi:outer membrane protein assembly factor BamB
MYKLGRTLQNIGDNRYYIDNYLIMHVHNKKEIKALSLDTYKEEWVIEHDHFTYHVYKNDIVTYYLNFYDVKKNLLYTPPYDNKLGLSIFNSNGLAIVRQIVKFEKIGAKYNILAKNHLFDLNSKQFIKQDIQLPEGSVSIINNSLFVMKKESKLFVYDYEKEEMIWMQDFSDAYTYKDPFSLNDKWVKATANKIYEYGDKIIVKVGMYYTLCFNLKTGHEIWKSKISGKFIICNDIAYAYTNGGSIAKIDLETGEILNKNGKFYKLPDLPSVKHERLGLIHVSASGNEMVFHDNALWYLVHSNGYSFVVKINSKTFEYEWIHQVETTEEVKDIKFYKDKMYLYDISGQLHIYTKE